MIRTLLRASSVLALGVVIQKALDLGLEIYLAAEWGTSGIRDAYLAAAVVMVAGSLVETGLLPYSIVIGRMGAPGRSPVLRSAGSITLLVATVAGVLTLVVRFGSANDRAVSHTEFIGAVLAYVVLTTMFAPLVVRAGLRIANGDYRYAAMRLPLIAGSMLLGGLLLPFGVASPAIGGALGTTIVTVLTARPFWFWAWPSRDALIVLSALFTLNAYPILTRLIVERATLSVRGDGTLAILDYAEKATAIFGWAGLAVLGPLMLGFGPQRSLRRRILIAFMGLSVVALLIALLAVPLVRLLFERGEFSSHDTDAVARLVRVLAWSIPLIATLPMLAPVATSTSARWVAPAIGLAGAVHVAVTLLVARGADPIWIAFSFNAGMSFLFLLALQRAAGQGATEEARDDVIVPT